MIVGPARRQQVPMYNAATNRFAAVASAQIGMQNAITGQHQADTSRINAQTGIYGAETNRLRTFLDARTGAGQSLAQIESQDASRRVSPFAAGIIARANQQQATLNDRYGHFMDDMWSKSRGQRDEVMGLLENVGQASRERIYRDAEAQRGSVGSQLAGSGLYNTSVLRSLQMQVDRNRTEALGLLDEGLRQQQAQYLHQITTDALNRHLGLASDKLRGQQQHVGDVMSADASMRGQVGTNAVASGPGTQALSELVSDDGVIATARDKAFPGLFDPNSDRNPLYQMPHALPVGTGGYTGPVDRSSLPWRGSS